MKNKASLVSVILTLLYNLHTTMMSLTEVLIENASEILHFTGNNIKVVIFLPLHFRTVRKELVCQMVFTDHILDIPLSMILKCRFS